MDKMDALIVFDKHIRGLEREHDAEKVCIHRGKEVRPV